MSDNKYEEVNANSDNKSSLGPAISGKSDYQRRSKFSSSKGASSGVSSDSKFYSDLLESSSKGE